jgi:hypothetical protein
MEGLRIGPVKQGYSVDLPQPTNDVLPRLAARIIALGPSSSGKTNALVTLLTDARFYRGKFEKIYWCSPTATVDPALDALREYVQEHLQQDQCEDPSFSDGIPVEFLQSRVDRAKKVSEYLKAKKASQKGFSTLIVLDDLADVKRGLPAIAKFVDSLFVKARHWGVSVILSTQKLKLPLISATVRVNATAILAWRIRSQFDLWDGLIYEYSALVTKEKLYAAYKQAVATPFNFLFINLLAADVNHMFFSGFTERFVMDDSLAKE